MARKRMIDPEFWSDEEIGQWSYEARLFYIGLWNFADDVGRFKAHPNLLKSQIFPYDQKFNIESLKKELNSKVQWYEVENLQYGYLRNFNKHQRIDRPQDSKLPKPPPFDEHSTNIRRTLVPNIREVNIKEEKCVSDFFTYFLLKTKKAFRLTDDCKHLIEGRLKDYTIDQLKKAVDNFVADPWEGRKDRLDLIYCIGKQRGKPDHLEKWLNMNTTNKRVVPV